jgi:hypothetical protein
MVRRPEAAFRYYLVQDYLFLIEFACASPNSKAASVGGPFISCVLTDDRS